MSGLNKVGEARVLRAEGDRMLADARAGSIASAARSGWDILRQSWDLTIREASFHLKSGPARGPDGRGD